MKLSNFICFFTCCVFFSATLLDAQPQPDPEKSELPDVIETGVREDLLRSNLQLQEQLHTTIRAIEQARREAEVNATKNAGIFTDRLNAVEKNLGLQRERDLQTIVAMRQSNRFALVVAAVLAGVGLIALFVSGYYQIRAMNRIAEVSALLSSTHAEFPRALGDASVAPQLNSNDQATSRFLAALERLEKRIHELDAPLPLAQGNELPVSESHRNGVSSGHNSDELTEVRTLLEKGQLLLNAGEADEALICFDKANSLCPDSAEALVKKGTALEALRKLPEAIETYERAIAADGSLTVAYLYKGGALNKLQRFSEAMECFEQALRTHPKAVA